MNRFNCSYPSDASMIAGRRTAAIARSVAGALVSGCILFVVALSGCQQPVSGNRVLDAGVVRSIPSQESDASLDKQLRLDPSELLFYTANVHG
jgi:hypothetical protein